MSNPTFVLEDREFKQALKKYCDLKKNVDPKTELRRRAKNVGMRLAKIYKDKGVSLQDITAKVNSLGVRVRIRPKIRARRGLTFKQKKMMELRARRSARGFTATGWFPAIEKLGGTPRDTVKRTGPRRGTLEERIGSFEKSETLINKQPGAGHVQSKNTALEQQALDAETEDMVKYIVRKQDEAARKNGL